MNRSSVNSSSSTVTSYSINTTNTSNSVTLSPLIKLERLIYRLNSLLTIKFDELSDEFEVQKQLKLLLQYQNEIFKLKEQLNNENIKNNVFEYENRIQWIESKISILDKIIKQLEEKLSGDSNVTKPETETTAEVSSSSNLTTITSDNINPKPSSPIISTDDILILPPKLETSLKSLPKEKSPNEKESLVFSEEIQSEHDNLTNELIATVQLIKRNNLHIQKMVKSDDKIITEASGLLETNTDTMQREGKNLKSYSKTAWVSFWKMLLILLFVCFVFIFVYIFIRLT